MPMNKSLYPLDWPQFSLSVRVERAGGRCECTGECGVNHQAEADANPEEIAVIGEVFPKNHATHRCMALNKTPHVITGSRVVLTVAHLCAEYCTSLATTGKLCSGAYMHVKAMCQRCHLRYDRFMHAANAAATRERRRLERQECLFDFQEEAA